MELTPDQDAYGAAIRAHHEGEESYEIVERDDGSGRSDPLDRRGGRRPRRGER